MDSAKLNDWLQLLGIAGVIASLIFVGMELQQSRQIAIADIYQQRAALAIDVQTSQMANERFGEIFEKYLRGEPFTASEKGLWNFSSNPWLSYYENNHFQYEMGLLSEEQWLSSRNSLRFRARSTIFQEWWAIVRPSWRESFAQEVDSVIAEENAKRRAENR